MDCKEQARCQRGDVVALDPKRSFRTGSKLSPPSPNLWIGPGRRNQAMIVMLVLTLVLFSFAEGRNGFGGYSPGVSELSHPPVITKVLLNVTAYTGLPFKITCEAITGHFGLMTLTRTDKKDLRVQATFPINAKNSTANINVQKIEYKLDKVLREDAGEYRCTASNKKGVAMVTGFLHVEEPRRPTVVEMDNVAFKTGETAVLTCRVSGAPSPTINWILPTHLPVDLSNAREDSQGQLVLENITKDHQGWYRCQARNLLGEDRGDVFLAVLSSEDSSTPLPPCPPSGCEENSKGKGKTSNRISDTTFFALVASFSFATGLGIFAIVTIVLTRRHHQRARDRPPGIASPIASRNV